MMKEEVRGAATAGGQGDGGEKQKLEGEREGKNHEKEITWKRCRRGAT